jgi:hypothetical protein
VTTGAGSVVPWAYLLNVVFIVVGWVVVHHLSARRDQDKSRRELIVKACDSLAASVDALRSVASRYHTQSRQVAEERSIQLALQDLAQQFTELVSICDQRDQLAACRSSLTALRRAVSGRHFSDEHVSPVEPENEIVLDIDGATSDLKKQITRLKYRQFPAK